MTIPEAARRRSEIYGVAQTQRGLVSARQLEAIGLSPSARHHAVRSGRLLRVRKGVYRLPGAPLTWETSVLAAILGSGTEAVASHWCAARLWRLVSPGGTGWSWQVELSAGRDMRMTGVRAHTSVIPPEERDFRRSVPVTSAPRTLLDLSARLPPARIGSMVDEALRLGVVTLRDLCGVVERHRPSAGGGTRGPGRLLASVADRGGSPGPGANAWEESMDRMWDRLGLPPAERQYWITTPDGRYCVDRAIVAERIAVEWNGYEPHGLRSQFDYDSRRRSHLLGAGWLALDFTSRTPPVEVVRAVHSAVALRRGARAS